MKEEVFLLILHLHQEKYAEDVMIALTEVGVKDVFSMTGINESRRLPHNIPIFAGFKGTLGKSSSLSKVFTAVVNDSGIIDSILHVLKRADIDLLGDDLGSIVLMPIHSLKGGKK
jgi:hypothetical protein